MQVIKESYNTAKDDSGDNLNLFKKYLITKDLNLRNLLAEKYLYIAEIMAKKLVNKGVDYDDLFQVSSLALLKAIDRFDPDKGLKFSTFATPSILGELKNYFRDKSRMIKPGRKNSLLMQKIKTAVSQLSVKNSRTPAAEDIAEFLNIKIDNILEVMEYNSSVMSLDQSIDDSDTSLYEIIPDTENIFDKFDDRDALKNALLKLTDEERKIINKRYVENLSQAEISQQMNVSQMFISRLEKKIINKLKKAFEIP